MPAVLCKLPFKGGLLQFSEEKDQGFGICEIKATVLVKCWSLQLM